MYFLDWIAAVWVHWVALMSGVISILIGLWVRFRRSAAAKRSQQSDITNRAFITVGGFCILLACYLAWADEHKSLAAERAARTPQLTLELLEASLFAKFDDPKSTAIVLVASLKNQGAPSVAFEWGLDVDLPNNPTMKADLSYLRVDELRLQRYPGDKDFRQFFIGDLLFDKVASVVRQAD